MTTEKFNPETNLIDNIVAAATEVIRAEGHGLIVSIWHLIDSLSDEYGEKFRVTPEVELVLLVAEQLWADPHIDQVDHGWVEFAWNEVGWPGVQDAASQGPRSH